MEKIYLKPCPFCGSEDIAFNHHNYEWSLTVICKNCFTESGEIRGGWDSAEPIAAIRWNTRTAVASNNVINPTAPE